MNEHGKRRIAESMRWNSHRGIWLTELEHHGRIPGEQATTDGWYLVSRHAGGTAAAYVTQSRLRTRHTTLEFKVGNTKDDDVEWDGVIYARRYPQEYSVTDPEGA